MPNSIMGRVERTVAVDFDGVIHAWRGVIGPPSDSPVPGAIAALASMVAAGKRVIIFSARCCCFDQEADQIMKNRAEIVDWLTANGANLDTHWHAVTGCKPVAGVYIDDRGLKFTNWPEAMQDLKLS